MSHDGRKGSQSRDWINMLMPIALLGLLILLAASIFEPVFPVLLWGSLLAVVCAHPYERLVSRLRGRRAIADGVFAMLMLMVLILPAIFFAWEAVLLLPKLAGLLESWRSGPMPELPPWIAEMPGAGPWVASYWTDTESAFHQASLLILAHLEEILAWLVTQVGTFGGFFAEFMLGAIVALFILHNRFAVRAFFDRFFAKVGGDLTRAVMRQAFEVTRASVAGLFAGAVLQTLLASIAIFAAGLPGLVIFAGLTFLMAMVQIGPILTMIIAATILVSQGSYMVALLLVIWFVAVVMTADNLIRPWFTSRSAGVPSILSFLGSLGGLLHWGLIGVFMGPVLATVLYQLLVAWMEPVEDLEP